MPNKTQSQSKPKQETKQGYKFPKLVIGIVTSELKGYCDLSFYSQLLNFKYPNYDYVIVDNSDSPTYCKQLIKMGLNPKNIYWVRDKNQNKPKDLKFKMADCNEITRKIAIKKGCDFFLNLESDIHLLEPSLINVMIAANRPVIAMPYFWGNVTSRRLLIWGGKEVSRDETTVEYTERKFDFFEGMLFVNGQIRDMLFGAIGCCLVRRDVLDKIHFHIDENNKKGNADLTFASDLINLRIQPEGLAIPALWHWQTDWDAINKLRN